MKLVFNSERALTRHSGECARAWRDNALESLSIGLQGELGSGKTTWVRGFLRGLGHAGPVPSPTYMLLEDYEFDGLTVTHLDLYRLAGAEELEYLGLRERLGEPGRWVLTEWPERAPQLLAVCDLLVRLEILRASRRAVELTARSDAGRHALAVLAANETKI